MGASPLDRVRTAARRLLGQPGTAARPYRVKAPHGRPLRVAVGIDFAPTPPAEWQAALDQECPPATNSSRLVIVWDGGDRWESNIEGQPGLGRWVILQCQPWHLITDEHIKSVIAGPHVRTEALLTRKLATIDGRNQWRYRVKGPHSSPFVDKLCYQTARHLIEREGYWCRPTRFWNVQGAEGGQPFALRPSERARWDQLGRTHFSLGDLPYAPFDARVLRAIRAYDLWQFRQGERDLGRFALRASIARMRDLELEAALHSWNAWDAKAEEMSDEIGFHARRDGLHRLRWDRPGHRPRALDLDQVRDGFLNSIDTEAVT